MLDVTLEPVLWPTRQAGVNNRRNARGFLFERMGAHGSSADRMAQRATPPSAGGQMVLYSSSSGKKSSLPAPASLPDAKISFVSDTPSEVRAEQSVHPDKVAWRLDARRVFRPRRRVVHIHVWFRGTKVSEE